MSSNTLPPEVFKALFSQALTSDSFRKKVARDPFGVLASFGYHDQIPTAIRTKLNNMIVIETNRARPHCEVCSICALCVLCGEADAGVAAGSVSSILALWPAEVFGQPTASQPITESSKQDVIAKMHADIGDEGQYL